MVNAQTPSMKISETGAIKSGQNVHFQVENMVYGITVPVEMVTLKTPSGEVNTGKNHRLVSDRKYLCTV